MDEDRVTQKRVSVNLMSNSSSIMLDGKEMLQNSEEKIVYERNFILTKL